MKKKIILKLEGKSMETYTQAWLTFISGVTAIVEQILGSDKGKKSKRVGVWES